MKSTVRSPAGVVLALLVLVWGLAYLVRYRYFLGLGGLETDYMAWAKLKFLGGISVHFLKAADAILTLDWSLSSVATPLTNPQTTQPTYPPTYPLLLAVLKWLAGHDLQMVRQLQMALDAAGVFLVFAICQRLQGRTSVAVLAALGYAVAPWWAWGASPLLADAIIPLLFLVFLLAALRARDGSGLAGWFFLGLAGAALTLARSEFGLLFAVIILLALVAAPGRRSAAVAVGMIGFWGPWLGVASINYITFGHFLPAANALFYALYSGLGQVANTFQYEVSDLLAGQRLAANGLRHLSSESEAFWKGIYLNAWLEHPGHVLRTILYRFDVIALGQEQTTFPTLFVPVFAYGLMMSVVAAVLLLVRQRFYDLLIVVGPLVFALFTLGLIYAELRYVRYASLTYLFGSAVVISEIATWADRWVGAFMPSLRKGLAYGVWIVAFVGLAGVGILPPDQEARKLLRAAYPQDFSTLPLLPVRTLVPAVEGARIEVAGETQTVIASPASRGYQVWTPLDAAGAGLLLLKFSVEPEQAKGWVAAILSADAQRIQFHTALDAQRAAQALHVIDPAGDPSVRLVFIETGVNAPLAIHRLEAAKVCGGYRPSLMWWLLPSPATIPRFNPVAC